MTEARTRIGGLALLLIVVLTYAGVGELGFVWDDNALVLENPRIQDLRQVPSYFVTDLWSMVAEEGENEASGYYRPLMLLSLAVDYALSGFEPAGYHVQSLLWHLLSCAALWALLRQLVSPTATLIGVAVFALHPMQSETVLWIAARNDSLAATFALTALSLVVVRDPGRLRLAAALVCAALALLSKESVLLLPAALLALDLGRGAVGGWRRYAVLIGGIAIALGLRLLSGVGESILPTAAAAELTVRRAPLILAQIFSTLLWPDRLSTAYSIEWLTLPPGRLLLGSLGAALAAGVPLLLPPQRRRLALAGLLLGVVFFLPAILPISSKGLLGDRYLYLSMAGGVLWLVSVLQGRWLWGAVLLLPLCVLRINVRMGDWRSELALWEASVRDVPSPYTFTGLAHALNSDAGDRGAALHLFVGSLSDPLPYAGACGHPITTALRSGRAALAAQVGWWSLTRGCPKDGDFVGRMSLALATRGEWEEAETLLALGETDDSGRSDVIRAALLKRAGDEAGYDRIRASWEGSTPLEEQVEALMTSTSDGD